MLRNTEIPNLPPLTWVLCTHCTGTLMHLWSIDSKSFFILFMVKTWKYIRLHFGSQKISNSVTSFLLLQYGIIPLFGAVRDPFPRNSLVLLECAGASTPPRQLPWLIFENIIDYKKWPKQIGRFQEKDILIFLPSKKTLLKYTVSFLQNWKNGFIILSSKKSP